MTQTKKVRSRLRSGLTGCLVLVLVLVGCAAEAPDSSVMPDSAMSSYQAGAPGPVEHTTAGTLEEICEAMLHKCVGNPDGSLRTDPYDSQGINTADRSGLVVACAYELGKIAQAGLLNKLQWVKGRTMFNYPNVTSILFTGKQRGKSFCVASTLGIFEALYWVGSRMRNRKMPEVFESLYMCTPCSPDAVPSESRVRIPVGVGRQHAESLRPTGAYASVFAITTKQNGVGVEVNPIPNPYAPESARDLHIPVEVASGLIELRIDVVDLDNLLLAAAVGTVLYVAYTALIATGHPDLALLFFYILNPELQPEMDGEIWAQQIEDAINVSIGAM
jgi:hypothetical protein